MGCFFFPERTFSWINYNSCLIQALNPHNGVMIILLEGGIPGTSWQPCNSGTRSWWGSSVHKRRAKQSRLGSMCWGWEAAEQRRLSQRWSWSVRPPDKQTPAKEKQRDAQRCKATLSAINRYTPFQTSEWCNPPSRTPVQILSQKPRRSPWGSWNKATGPAHLCKSRVL